MSVAIDILDEDHSLRLAMRRLAADALLHALRAEQLQGLGDVLRDADDPRTCVPRLQAALSSLAASSAALLIPADTGLPAEEFGEVDADQRAGLQLRVLRSAVIAAEAVVHSAPRVGHFGSRIVR